MRLLDPKFRYTNSASTDIRRLFDRVQPGWNQKPRKKRMPQNVTQIRKAKA